MSILKWSDINQNCKNINPITIYIDKNQHDQTVKYLPLELEMNHRIN